MAIYSVQLCVIYFSINATYIIVWQCGCRKQQQQRQHTFTNIESRHYLQGDKSSTDFSTEFIGKWEDYSRTHDQNNTIYSQDQNIYYNTCLYAISQ